MTGADVSRESPSVPPALGIGSSTGRESGRDDFYDHLLHVCLLLLLQESASSSADLRDRLRPLGFEQNVAAIEAALDVLSQAGLVRPPGTPASAAAGYAVTPEGGAWLRAATSDLRRTEVVLGGFLARCGERLLSLS